MLIRFAAYLTPQILISLFMLGQWDLLGGWNQTNVAFAIIVALFFLSPIVAGYVFASDAIHLVTWRHDPDRKLPIWMPILALMIFAESLAIDLYLLTQVRM